MREVEAGENLLAEITKREEQIRSCYEKEARSNKEIRESFPNYSYQLGVPTRFGSDTGHTLYHVSPALAEACIKAHVTNKRAELLNLQIIAKVELGENKQPGPGTASEE